MTYNIKGLSSEQEYKYGSGDQMTIEEEDMMLEKEEKTLAYGVFENGQRYLFSAIGRGNIKTKRARYIDELIDIGEFKTSDRQMLREVLEIKQITKIEFGKGVLDSK